MKNLIKFLLLISVALLFSQQPDSEYKCVFELSESQQTNFEKGKNYAFKFVLNENQWMTPPYKAKNIMIDGGVVNLSLLIKLIFKL